MPAVIAINRRLLRHDGFPREEGPNIPLDVEL